MALKDESRSKKQVKLKPPTNLPFLGGIQITIDQHGNQIITDIPDVFKTMNPVRGNIKKPA